MLSLFRRLVQADGGATAIEYTLIAGLIALATIVGLRAVGVSLTASISNVANLMG